jgi:hypothetical protein
VDGAGGVEGFLRGAGRESGAQEGVLVAVAGGGVDREAEGVGGAAVAQPEQRICWSSRSTPVMQAKLPWYLSRTLASCGQFFSE